MRMEMASQMPGKKNTESMILKVMRIDGLTNVEEFELRTKPNKADSDEDGLSDKDEIEVQRPTH